MNDPVAAGARAAAERLSAIHGPSLIADVEAELHHREADRRPDQFVDPIALGSLIVAVATLAWTVYKDLRSKNPATTPSPQVVSRTVTTQLRRKRTLTREEIEIVTTTVEETLPAIEGATAHDESAS